MDAGVGSEVPRMLAGGQQAAHLARIRGLTPARRYVLPLLFLAGAVAAAVLGPGYLAALGAACWLAGLSLPGMRWPLFMLALGVLVVGGAIERVNDRRLHGAEQLDLMLTGRTLAPLLSDGGGLVHRFDLLVEQCQPACRVRRVRLANYDPVVMQEGERWRLRARLRAPRALANPGRGDAELRLWRLGVDAQGYLQADRTAERLARAPPPAALKRLQQLLAARIETGVPIGAGLLRALLLGDRSAVSSLTWRRLAATGTTHLFVVSGLHVALVTGAVLLVLRLFGLGPADSRAALLALLAASAFAVLTGFGVPVRRALAMLALLLLARVAGRASRTTDLLLRAAALVVLFDPLAVLDFGFWLSCLAVAALVLGGEPGPVGMGVGNLAWRWLKPQWAVALVLLLPLLAAFGWVPLLSPFINLLLVPLVGLLVLPVSLLALSASALAPDTASAVLAAMGMGLDGLLRVLAALEIPLALSPPHPLAGALALGLALLVLTSAPRRLRALAACLLVCLLAAPIPRPERGAFEVRVFDVGQGLAVLVRTRTRVLLFDTGGRFGIGANAGALVIAPALRTLGISRIDRVLVSHADTDHVGGLPGILASLAVGEILGPPGLAATTRPCEAPMSWGWDGVQFKVFHPPRLWTESGNRNRSSCVLRVQARNGAVAVIPGDIDRYVERRIAPAVGPTDLMIAAHHGSRTSSGRAWVRHTQPDFVVFATGASNAFGHPHAEVVARWYDAGACLLTAGKTGMLVWSSAAPTRIDSWRARRAYWWRWAAAGEVGACEGIKGKAD